MKKRLVSLILLLLLAASALAGTPLHFGESGCSMSGMMDMDCCKAALLQSETIRVSEAEVYCALNCAQNGTTSPSNVRVTSPSPVRTPSHPAITQSLLSFSSLRTRSNYHLHGPPGAAAPTYLRHLALLI